MDNQEPDEERLETLSQTTCSPIICPFYHYSSCGWMGSIEDMMGHCTLKHAKHTSRGNKQNYVIPNFKSIKKRKDFPHVIEAHGNVFMVWLQKFPSGFLRIRLHSMGCCYDPHQYKGFIVFRSYEELPLKCYSAFEYGEGLEKLDDTKIYVNTSAFLLESEDLYYTIRIKDKSLELYLERLS